MPLTALHAELGVLDLSVRVDGTDRVGGEVVHVVGSAGLIPWAELHRARPRPPLTCRECGHGLHAKRSKEQFRFFAHDAHPPECGSVGESIDHRLLKVELASAIRDAGWVAALEQSGDGWRADVLATTPDGRHRMAWEAQLAAATATQLQERSARMYAQDVDVCWVTDKDRPWLGHVPSIRIASPDPDDPNAGSGYRVVDGVATFRSFWCERRDRCEKSFIDRGAPCRGHGGWDRPSVDLVLAQFVGYVLGGTLWPHYTQATRPYLIGRHTPGNLWWTSWRNVPAEQEQLDARSANERWHEARRPPTPPQDAHSAAIEALLRRQDALEAPVLELVRAHYDAPVSAGSASPEWAMGVPIHAGTDTVAVVCPVAKRIAEDPCIRERFRAWVLIAADDRERDRLARVCARDQRLHVVRPFEHPPASATPDAGPRTWLHPRRPHV